MKPTKKSKPGKVIRLLLIVAVTLVGTMALALAIVPNFIPWNKVKVQAEEKLSTLIRHQVKIDTIKFNPIKGIELKGVTIANRTGFSKAPLLVDDAAVVKYRLLPILFGKIVVKAIELKRPQLLIEKNKSGQFNFSDMISKSESKSKRARSKAHSNDLDKTKSFGKLPLAILVSYIGIEDATLIYRDLKQQQEYKLEAFNFKISNLTLAGLTPITVLMTTNVQALGKKIPVKFKSNWRFNYKEQQLKLDMFLLDVPGIALTAQGQVTQALTKPFITLQGQTQFSAKTIMSALIPETITERLPEKVALTGPMTNTFKVSGYLSQLNSLQAVINHQLDLTVSSDQLSAPITLKGQLDLTPTQLTIESLRARVSNESLTFSLNAQGFDLRDPSSLSPAKMKTNINWTLESKQLDLGTLLAMVPKKKKIKSSKAGQATKKKKLKKSKLIEPDARQLIPKGLVMKGQASLGGLTLGKVSLGALTVATKLEHQVSTTKVKLLGYQGEVVNQTRLNFDQRKLAFATNSAITGVDLEPLLNDILDTYVAAKLKKPKIIEELKDKMTGRLTGQVIIKSSGMNTTTIGREMIGSGQVKLLGSRLRRLAFQQQLATWFGNEKFNQDLPFDHTTLVFNLANEMVEVAEFIAQSGPQGLSGDMRLMAQGKISFGAEFKDFRLHPRVNPRAAKNMSVDYKKYIEILKDEHGWVALPMLLNGPIRKPDVKPDWEWIHKRFKKYGQKKINKATEKAKKKAANYIKKQAGQSTEKIKENIQQELKKLNLNNLFK